MSVWSKKKCHFSRKFDLWPDLTRSNVDLGLNNMCNRETSSRRIDWFFFPRSSTTIRGRSPGGGGGRANHPPDRPRYEKCPDRARVNIRDFESYIRNQRHEKIIFHERTKTQSPALFEFWPLWRWQPLRVIGARLLYYYIGLFSREIGPPPWRHTGKSFTALWMGF